MHRSCPVMLVTAFAYGYTPSLGQVLPMTFFCANLNSNKPAMGNCQLTKWDIQI